MKNIKLIITIIFSIAITSAIAFSFVGCGDGGGGSSAYAENGGTTDPENGGEDNPENGGEADPGAGDDPITPEPESQKYYVMNPFESAEFYFVTTAGKEIYAYNDGYLKKIKLTVTVSQDGKPDVIENITPVDFYKLGDMFFIECNIEGKTRYFRQVYGVMTEVESLMRRPDTIRQVMNNGRFSIVVNTYENYTVNDIRNETTESGICRTILCQGYYLGKREMYYDYGLWFCTVDTIGRYKSGLYYWSEPENGGIEKVIDEAGELWK